MKFLVTGSRGMLGSDLMGALGGGDGLRGYDIEDLDITDPVQCRMRVGEFRPDVILNAAALTRVDHCESHEEEAFRVNARGAGNLAELASESGALLVHFSTDYVFDGRKKEPYVEDDPTGPINVYGRSKLEGEVLIRLSGATHLIIRTSWLFGRDGVNFIRTILNAAQGNRQLRVVDDQRGSPTYTRDLATQTVKLLEAGCRGTYHVTNSGACTWHELARFSLKCADIQGIEVTPVATAAFPRPATRPANSVLANARLSREGLPLMRHWTEGVAEYVLRLTIDD